MHYGWHIPHSVTVSGSSFLARLSGHSFESFVYLVRTAAGSGAATRQMASKNSTQLLVFGAGLQAKLHIHAMLAVRAFECGEIRPLKILKPPEVDFDLGMIALVVTIINRSSHRSALLIAELALCFPTVVFREIPLDHTAEVLTVNRRSCDQLSNPTFE